MSEFKEGRSQLKKLKVESNAPRANNGRLAQADVALAVAFSHKVVLRFRAIFFCDLQRLAGRSKARMAATVVAKSISYSGLAACGCSLAVMNHLARTLNSFMPSVL